MTTWTEESKNSTSFTNDSLNSASFTVQDKSQDKEALLINSSDLLLVDSSDSYAVNDTQISTSYTYQTKN